MNGFIDFILKNPDNVAVLIAGLALILSFLSTILTLCSVWLQRIHNRVSVRPIAESTFSDFEDHLAVKIRNNGLGPLIIKKFEICRENKIIADNLIELMPSQAETISWKNFVMSINNRVLIPGEELCILDLVGDQNNREFTEFRDKVRKALAPLIIRIHYKSIYNENRPSYCSGPQKLDTPLRGR